MRMLPPPGWADAACSRPRRTESAPRWPASPVPFLRFREKEGNSVSLLGRFALGAIESKRNGDGTSCRARLSSTAPGSYRQARARDRSPSTLFPDFTFRQQRLRGYVIGRLSVASSLRASATTEQRGHEIDRPRRCSRPACFNSCRAAEGARWTAFAVISCLCASAATARVLGLSPSAAAATPNAINRLRRGREHGCGAGDAVA